MVALLISFVPIAFLFSNVVMEYIYIDFLTIILNIENVSTLSLVSGAERLFDHVDGAQALLFNTSAMPSIHEVIESDEESFSSFSDEEKPFPPPPQYLIDVTPLANPTLLPSPGIPSEIDEETQNSSEFMPAEPFDHMTSVELPSKGVVDSYTPQKPRNQNLCAPDTSGSSESSYTPAKKREIKSLVEYSDVSSEEFSEPEAGELTDDSPSRSPILKIRPADSHYPPKRIPSPKTPPRPSSPSDKGSSGLDSGQTPRKFIEVLKESEESKNIPETGEEEGEVDSPPYPVQQPEEQINTLPKHLDQSRISHVDEPNPTTIVSYNSEMSPNRIRSNNEHRADYYSSSRHRNESYRSRSPEDLEYRKRKDAKKKKKQEKHEKKRKRERSISPPVQKKKKRKKYKYDSDEEPARNDNSSPDQRNRYREREKSSKKRPTTPPHRNEQKDYREHGQFSCNFIIYILFY